MLIPKRGDMYVADLGEGIGSEQANERPVVIIQNNKGNHYADTTIIVPITSQMKAQLPNHVIIHYGILTKYQGCVLTEQIRTISVLRLKGIVSILDPRASSRIKTAYREEALSSLPEKNMTENITELKRFWRKIRESYGKMSIGKK